MSHQFPHYRLTDFVKVVPIASHIDVLRVSAHSFPHKRRKEGTSDEALKTSAWEAIVFKARFKRRISHVSNLMLVRKLSSLICVRDGT